MDFDQDDALERVGGDAAHLRELLQLFSSIYPPVAEKISRALVKSDFASIEREAHGLAGSLNNLGAKRAAAAAQRLSEATKDGGRDRIIALAQELAICVKDFIKLSSAY